MRGRASSCVLALLLSSCAVVHRWPNGAADCVAVFNATCQATPDGSVHATGQLSEPTWAGVLSSLITAAGAAYAIGR